MCSNPSPKGPNLTSFADLGFRVQDLGCRVWGLGCTTRSLLATACLLGPNICPSSRRSNLSSPFLKKGFMQFCGPKNGPESRELPKSVASCELAAVCCTVLLCLSLDRALHTSMQCHYGKSAVLWASVSLKLPDCTAPNTRLVLLGGPEPV